MKRTIIVILCIGLLACGSNGAGSKAEMAAQACDTFAKNKLEGKLYQLDLKVLAASMKPVTDKTELTAPIVIEPGLPTEVKQTLECEVIFGANDSSVEVINMTFIWQ
jgi:hypothetical protein